MLVVVDRDNIHQHQRLVERAFRFRHSIFVEEKVWDDLRKADGYERDRFDDEHAVHQILLHDDEIVGYQQLLPTTRPHLLTGVLNDLCKVKPPGGPRVAEWTRFCVAPVRREVRPRSNGLFLELTQGVVEWGMPHDVDTVTIAIDTRLIGHRKMQLRFFVRPLRFPKRIDREDIVALRMSFNRETLATFHEARGCDHPALPTAAPLRRAA